MSPITPATPTSVDLLTYLRERSSIDYDCLDPTAAEKLGPFEDCTSNQWEAFAQLSNPKHAALLKEAIAHASRAEADFRDVSPEELAVEYGMILLSLRMIPLIRGSIHVMCNPLYSWNTEKVYKTGHRFHKIAHDLDPSFDLSRLIMKVPATWEGLQACRKLKDDNIKTLATTLFTMEQVVLAGEAGCISISPFAHELRAHLDTSYHDTQPIMDLFLQAQMYYQQHGVPTKVKSCAFMTIDEIITMAGVDAMTLPAEVLEELSNTKDTVDRLEEKSVFHAAAQSLQAHSARLTKQSYIDDEAGFLRAYCTQGRGRAKTEDSIAVFCKFQVDAESLMAQHKLRAKL
ncbi:Transaldolase [Cercospora beticola]|uniref:Transaldolase n=1 Tax=Cercospora beticola TaxID=122368 RepID=A0A2G5I7P8_CERBT|nr:Transaldolase [Cercospora beticola]PIB00866.1 Transaldolase [Cercospora beticola]WPA95413.1 hypothetical protein RHO25_000012 [Cercospora beticola]CAK1356381.1 unnamed protein product [Cercospora beticola]